MRLRRTFAVFLAVSAFTACAAASGGSRFINDCMSYTDDDGNRYMFIMCAGNPDDVSVENIGVTIGGNDCEIVDKDTHTNLEMAVSYCCLVDVSGSIKPDQLQQEKDALNAIVDSMGEYDNMSISTLGNAVSYGGYTGDKDALKATIASLAISKEDTNLYAGIGNSIGEMEKDSSLNPGKALVIVSDGRDDMVSGYTRDEAIRAVSESRIPVHTIAAIRNKNDAENAKSLGEFARLSVGGTAYAPVVDGITAAEAGANIANNVMTGYWLAVDINDIAPNEKNEFPVRIKIDRDGKISDDSLTINSDDMVDVADKHIHINPIDSQRSFYDRYKLYIFITGGILLAALIGLAVFLLIHSKRKRKTAQMEFNAAPENITPAQDISVTDDFVPAVDDPEFIDTPQNIGFSGGYDPIKAEPAVARGKKVKLVMLGDEKKSYELFLHEDTETFVGRTDKSDYILDSKDKKLSGRHFVLIYSRGGVYMRDAGSSNGTSHNGIPISAVGMVKLNHDDIIRAGGREYRFIYGSKDKNHSNE